MKRAEGSAAARVKRAAVVLAALAVFAWLAWHVASGTAIMFDEPVRAWVHTHSCPWLTALMRAASVLGEAGVLLILSAGVGLYWKRAAARFLVMMLGAYFVDTGLKLAFHRARPESFFGTPLPASYSFPSGHALFAICFFGGLAALVGRRVTVWTAAAAMAFLIGLSRVYLGVHYPSDVVAGYAVGLAILVLHFDQKKPAGGR
ncbi:MAG: phosphatase PAP2 family protein [Acidobacteriota bacterium]